MVMPMTTEIWRTWYRMKFRGCNLYTKILIHSSRLENMKPRFGRVRIWWASISATISHQIKEACEFQIQDQQLDLQPITPEGARSAVSRTRTAPYQSTDSMTCHRITKTYITPNSIQIETHSHIFKNNNNDFKYKYEKQTLKNEFKN